MTKRIYTSPTLQILPMSVTTPLAGSLTSNETQLQMKGNIGIEDAKNAASRSGRSLDWDDE